MTILNIAEQKVKQKLYVFIAWFIAILEEFQRAFLASCGRQNSPFDHTRRNFGPGLLGKSQRRLDFGLRKEGVEIGGAGARSRFGFQRAAPDDHCAIFLNVFRIDPRAYFVVAVSY